MSSYAAARLDALCQNHKELKTGTLGSVLKQAGLSVEDFLIALR